MSVVQGSELSEEARDAKKAEIVELEKTIKDKSKEKQKKKTTAKYSGVRFFGEKMTIMQPTCLAASLLSALTAIFFCTCSLCLFSVFASCSLSRTSCSVFLHVFSVLIFASPLACRAP